MAAASLIGCGGPPPEELETSVSAVSSVDVNIAVRGYTRSDGVHAVVFRKPNNPHLFELAGLPGTQRTLTDMGGVSGRAPWGYQRTDGANVTMYAADNGDIHEVGRNANGVFIDNNWTTLSFVQAPATFPTNSGSDCDVIGIARPDGKNMVVYRDANAHLIEVVSNFPAYPPWIVNDLTQAGYAHAVAENPFPFIRADGHPAIVYVRGNEDRHIYEVVDNGPGASPPFTETDLHQASGETLPSTSGPWAYKRHDGLNAVVFASHDARLHELTWGASCSSTGQTFCAGVIPAVASASLFDRPSGYVRADGRSAVVYQGSGSVHEATLIWNSPWVDNVLPTAGWDPFRAPFAFSAPGGRSYVLFSGHNNQDSKGVELSLNTGSNWALETF